MKLTEAQSKWLSYLMPPGEMLKRFLRTAVGRKSVGDKTFEKRFYHFIAGGKGVPDDLAAAIWRSIGIVEKDLALAELLKPEKLEKNDKFDSRRFIENCSKALWCGVIGKKTVNVDTAEASAILGLMDRILARRKSFSTEDKRSILGEMTDYLTETRDYRRWEKWVSELPVKIIEGESPLTQKEETLFPSVKEFLSPGFEKIAEERAFRIRYRGLHINYLRHRLFGLRRKLMALNEKKEAQPKGDQGKFDNVIAATQKAINEVHDDNGIRGEFLAVKEPLTEFLEGIAKVKDLPTDGPRRYFLFCCLRLLGDWGKYHYTSTAGDSSIAGEALKLVRKICNKYVDLRKRLVADKKWSSHASDDMFPYLDSTSCLKICDATRCRSENEAYDVVCEMLKMANHARRVSLMSKSSAAEYRADRNYARCLTTAARWWLKTGKKMVVGTNQKVDGYWLIENAARIWRDTLIPALKSAENKENGRVVLRYKRALEHEFHLRVQIELLIADTKRKDGESEEVWLHRAEVAYCKALLIYCHLFPSTSKVVADAAEKWLKAHCKNEDDTSEYFRVEDLKQSRQENPPSRASRLESAWVILHAGIPDLQFAAAVTTVAAKILKEHVYSIAKFLQDIPEKDRIPHWQELRYEPAADINEAKRVFKEATRLPVPEEI